MKLLADQNELKRVINEIKPTGHRRMVALCGGPGSGKTTLATELAAALTRDGNKTAVLPMDGFHLDDRVLKARQLLSRKGAPETFDVAGFTVTLHRLTEPGEVVHPVFDRDREIAIAGAAVIDDTCRTVIVEGNYLMLKAPGWEALSRIWNLSVALDPGFDTLRERLVARWRGFGLSEEEINNKVEGNDLPNARLIHDRSAPCDYRLDTRASTS